MHVPLQIWMCLKEDLTFEDCDQACPGPGCHNIDCRTPMLYPDAPQTAAREADCTGAACRLRDAASKARPQLLQVCLDDMCTSAHVPASSAGNSNS